VTVERAQPVLLEAQLAQVGEATQRVHLELPDLVAVEHELAKLQQVR